MDMKIEYRRAGECDCDELIRINNEAYRADFLRYGECPGYQISYDQMRESLQKEDVEKYLIYVDGIAVGVVSIVKKAEHAYYLSNLCIVPEYQHRGIGQKAIAFVVHHYRDLKELSLVTPADKEENVSFYTKKCGFKIIGEKMDGNVKVAIFTFQK